MTQDTGTLPPAVIVHGLDMALAALAHGHKLTLLSAPGAAIYGGVGWWQALVQAARAANPDADPPDILDCGDAVGRALEALRAGQRRLVLRSARLDPSADPSTRPSIADGLMADIAGRARALGAILLESPPPALDLGRQGSQRLLDSWLNGPA